MWLPAAGDPGACPGGCWSQGLPNRCARLGSSPPSFSPGRLPRVPSPFLVANTQPPDLSCSRSPNEQTFPDVHLAHPGMKLGTWRGTGSASCSWAASREVGHSGTGTGCWEGGLREGFRWGLAFLQAEEVLWYEAW